MYKAPFFLSVNFRSRFSKRPLAGSLGPFVGFKKTRTVRSCGPNAHSDYLSMDRTKKLKNVRTHIHQPKFEEILAKFGVFERNSNRYLKFSEKLCIKNAIKWLGKSFLKKF